MSARFATDWRLVAALTRRDPNSPLVFHRNGIAIRRWRTAWRAACQATGVPTRFLHDCRRTAARNPPAPDVRRHATWPQSWMQRENWEFETHRSLLVDDNLQAELERLRTENARLKRDRGRTVSLKVSLIRSRGRFSYAT